MSPIPQPPPPPPDTSARHCTNLHKLIDRKAASSPDCTQLHNVVVGVEGPVNYVNMTVVTVFGP